MINSKQIVLIIAVLTIMGVLVVKPISGLIDEQPEAVTSSETGSSENTYDLLSVSDIYKKGINPSLAEKISDLEKRYGEAKDEDKQPILSELAENWDDLAKYPPLGFVYEEIASINPSYDNWLKAGKAYQTGYTNLQDTSLTKELNNRAIQAYKNSLELNPNSLAAKTGLGSALVTGGNNPMEGITLLQEVVREEPRNLEANNALGLFSLQSRQFDKAIERFLVVVEQQPNAEAYFYLATAYENIGMKNDAISAFEKSKEIAADPTLSQFIDRKIEELRN